MLVRAWFIGEDLIDFDRVLGLHASLETDLDENFAFGGIIFSRFVMVVLFFLIMEYFLD